MIRLIPTPTPTNTETSVQQAARGYAETILGNNAQPSILNQIVGDIVQHRENLMRLFWLATPASDGKPVTTADKLAAMRKVIGERNLQVPEQALFAIVALADQFIAGACQAFGTPMPELTKPTHEYTFNEQGQLVLGAPVATAEE